MAISVERSDPSHLSAILGLAAAAILSGAPAFGKDVKLVQLRNVTASGTHQCGPDKDRSCVVSGSFTNCNDASISLRTRDCCPTTPKGGASSGFTLIYCIPDRAP